MGKRQTNKNLKSLQFAILASRTEKEKANITARWLLETFSKYYDNSILIPKKAQIAFEKRHWQAAFNLSKRRLSMYSETVRQVSTNLVLILPDLAKKKPFWTRIEKEFSYLVNSRYEADFAYSFILSIRRILMGEYWEPTPRALRKYPPINKKDKIWNNRKTSIFYEYRIQQVIKPEIIEGILKIPNFSIPFRNLKADSQVAANYANMALVFNGNNSKKNRKIQVINAGFFRNRGCYIVGRIISDQEVLKPFVLALLNSSSGIFIDAVLTEEAHSQTIFSSTLANFHVTNPYYHELSAFLQSTMPKRPLGLHYTTIGFNHIGKVTVLQEIAEEIAASGENLDTAIGFRGTVAMGFSTASSAYVLKVIRDKPTKNYKWGNFEGIESVLEKYRKVHRINRTGSMLDNIIYQNLKLPKNWFSPSLLSEISFYAQKSVSIKGDSVVFQHLIIQPKLTPLPIFFENASLGQIRRAVINLGYCIKNNAAANIFNKDLDSRNYGVSHFLKVYLFDYDAVEPLTDIKVRTNSERYEGEEDIPEWFFEDGHIFLPEEIEVGLRINDRGLKRVFKDIHSDLLTVDYWVEMQAALLDGKVPEFRAYPETARLRHFR